MISKFVSPVTVTASKVQVYLQDAHKTARANYNFQIEAKAEGNKKYKAIIGGNMDFTLNVICG